MDTIKSKIYKQRLCTKIHNFPCCMEAGIHLESVRHVGKIFQRTESSLKIAGEQRGFDFSSCFLKR
jgi:hypothetical protein